MQPYQASNHAVLGVQEQFWKALQTRDATLFETVLAPDYVGRSPGEPDQTREEFIATLTAFPFPINAIRGEGIEVHVFGEVAILTGVQVAQMQLPDGKARSSQVMLSNVFLQRDQRWRMVLSHAFELVQDL